MAKLRFRDPGPFDDLGELRDELSTLRVDLAEANAQLARRDRQVRGFDNRVRDVVDAVDPPDVARSPRSVALAATHGVVPSLDVLSLDEARRVVERTTRVDGVVAYKVGMTLTLPHGLGATFGALRDATDHPLIYDHQSAGLQDAHTGAAFSRICADAGVDGVVLFPAAGPEAVSEFVINAYKNGLLPLVGGGASEATDAGFFPEEALFNIIDRCAALSADHFVVPVSNVERLRLVAEWLTSRLEEPALFLTGTGDAGETIPSVFSATEGCRTYAVIAGDIFNAEDATEAARRFAAQALEFV